MNRENAVDVIDVRTLDQLLELIGGEQAELVELVKTFLVEADDIVGDMQRAVNDDDVELLRRSAHSLKSSAQDFGASQLSKACATLESGSKTAMPDAAVGQVGNIAEHWAAARQELEQYIN